MKSDEVNFLAVFFEGDEASGTAELPPAELTEKIIGCAHKVSNSLGCGFLEKVYENSLAHELVERDFTSRSSKKSTCSMTELSLGSIEQIL